MKWGGKEGAQLNKLEEYLKQLKLLDSRNSYPNGGFNLSAVRGLDYVDVWKTHVKHQWYDLRLDDNSLFFFNVHASCSSMAIIPNYFPAVNSLF